LPPRKEVVERLRESRRNGFKIVVYTARNMRTFAGDVSRINTVTLPIIMEWLAKHDVPHDGVIVGKPWPGPAGFYVDDKAVRPDEFVRMSDEQIQQIIGKGD